MSARAQDVPAPLNVQFATATEYHEGAERTRPDGAVPLQNNAVSPMTGCEGILSGGSYWNLIRPDTPSFGTAGWVRHNDFHGTFNDLKDARENPSKITVSIPDGIYVFTSARKNQPEKNVYPYAIGFEKLLNSSLAAKSSKSILLAGLEPGALYDLVLFGRGISGPKGKQTATTTFRVNDEEKSTAAFDIREGPRAASEGIDYVIFRSVPASTDGEISIEFSPNLEESNASRGGYLNGLQIEKAVLSKPQ